MAYTLGDKDGKSRTKRRKSKKRKLKRRSGKVSRSCVANNVPADRSFLLNAKQLLRYKL